MFKLSLALMLSTLSWPLLASPLENLQPVGNASLKVLFWTIYDSRLFSPNGRYEGIEPGLALQISYRRDIPARELIRRTREEWQRLGFDSDAARDWLDRMGTIWPDIESGDVITLRVDEQLNSDFYFNGESIGSLEESRFTERFLAIWLSEDSRFPRLRAQLIGSD